MPTNDLVPCPPVGAAIATWLLPALLLAGLSTATPSAGVQVPGVHAIEARVPVPPAVVTVEGRPHLVYELHLTNLRREAIEVSRVTVRGAASTPLVELTGGALGAALVHLGVAARDRGAATLPPGRRAVVYVWTPLAGRGARSRQSRASRSRRRRAVPPLHAVVTTAPIAVAARRRRSPSGRRSPEGRGSRCTTRC